MSALQAHIDRMESRILPIMEPGQVWIVRPQNALQEVSFILIGPRPEEDARWDSCPYDVLRTKLNLGHPNHDSQLELVQIGELFEKLRSLGEMRRSHWSRHLFTNGKSALLYEKLFSYQPW